jgi:5-methylcytosine-specific restriction enzyme A
MARSAKFPCRQAGCGKLLDTPGHCDQHRREVFKNQKQLVTIDYKERNRFYQRKAWKDARAAQLRREPLCRECRRNGKLVEAVIVDHIVPISLGGSDYDPANHQSLCLRHHAIKGMKEKGMIS